MNEPAAVTFDSNETVNCLNCGHRFSGAYCPSCGQKHGEAMPTTKEIIGDLMRSALSPSGKLFESLRLLLLKPGEITRAYISGQRVRYVHPVRLYLLGVFFFAAAVSLNGQWREWHQQSPLEVAAAAQFSSASENKVGTDDLARTQGKKIAQSVKETLPPWMNDWIKSRAARVGDESPEKMQTRAMNAMKSNYSLLFAVMVPFTALINWLLYWRRGYSYAAHFVYMLHGTAAAGFIGLIAYVLNLPVLYYPTLLLMTVWYVLAARRAFAVSLWGALWRYVLMFIPTGLFSALIGMVLAVAAILFG